MLKVKKPVFLALDRAKQKICEFFAGDENKDRLERIIKPFEKIEELLEVLDKGEGREKIDEKVAEVIKCTEQWPIEDGEVGLLTGAIYFLHVDGESVEEALQKIRQSAQEAMKNKSEDTCCGVEEILYNLAVLYDVQEEYQKAEYCYKTAIAVKQEKFGLQNPETLRLMNDQVRFYLEWKEYEEAEKISRDVMETLRQDPEADLSILLDAMKNLIWIYQKKEKFDLLGPLLNRALKTEKQVSGVGHMNVYDLACELSNFYYRMDRCEDGEMVLKNLLKNREKALGARHPDTAIIMGRLAHYYYLMNKCKQAEKLCKRALAIQENALETEPHRLAETIDTLAAIRSYQEKYDEAEEMCQHSLEIREKALGTDHHLILDTLDILSDMYFTRHDHEKAELMLERKLRIKKGKDYPWSPDLFGDMKKLWCTYMAMEKYEKAVRLCEQIFEAIEEDYEEQGIILIELLNYISYAYSKKQKFELAEKILQRSLVILERELGAENGYLIRILETLAAVYKQQKKYEAAEQTCKRAIKLGGKMKIAPSPFICSIKKMLGDIYADQGRHEFAEKLHNEAVLDGKKLIEWASRHLQKQEKTMIGTNSF